MEDAPAEGAEGDVVGTETGTATGLEVAGGAGDPVAVGAVTQAGSTPGVEDAGLADGTDDAEAAATGADAALETEGVGLAEGAGDAGTAPRASAAPEAEEGGLAEGAADAGTVPCAGVDPGAEGAMPAAGAVGTDAATGADAVPGSGSVPATGAGIASGGAMAVFSGTPPAAEADDFAVWLLWGCRKADVFQKFDGEPLVTVRRVHPRTIVEQTPSVPISMSLSPL